MNPNTQRQLNRIDQLVKAAGQNIIDIIALIKEMKAADSNLDSEELASAEKTASNLETHARYMKKVTMPRAGTRYTIGVDPAKKGGDTSVVSKSPELQRNIPLTKDEQVKKNINRERHANEYIPPVGFTKADVNGQRRYSKKWGRKRR